MTSHASSASIKPYIGLVAISGFFLCVAVMFVTRVSPARTNAPPSFTTPGPVAIADSPFARKIAVAQRQLATETAITQAE